MRVGEFFGGFLVGSSVLFISLGIVFVDVIRLNAPTGAATIRLEFIFPYLAGILSGLGLGYGMKGEEGGLSFSDLGERWPVLIGAISFASIFGILMILFLSFSSVLGLALALIAALLATVGLVLTIVSWVGMPY